MSRAKKTASTPSPEIRLLPKAKQEADEAFYADMPDKDRVQPLLLVANGVLSKLVDVSHAHTATATPPQPERILKSFIELGQLLATPILDDYRIVQHLPVALQLDNPKWAANPFRQAVHKLLTLASKSEDMRETATARSEARQQLTVDIGEYLREGIAEEIGADLMAVARTFPSGKDQVEEEPAAETPEPHPPADPATTPNTTSTPVIWYHGGQSYSTDGLTPELVTTEMHNALKMFLDRSEAVGTEGLENAGVSNVASVVSKIETIFGKTAVRRPRRQRKGAGYFIRVHSVKQGTAIS